MIYTYVIKTDASTTYQGGSCASIHAGTRLTFTGTRPSNNELLFNASQITISTETTPTPTPTPTPAPTPVQAEVTITGVTGTCPDVAFMVGSYTFKTSSSTQYSGATCADLKTGATVTVVGTKREGDGFIVVTGVGIKRSESTPPTTSPTNPSVPTTPVSGEGVVTYLVGSTSCPSLTFMISTYSIAVNASTQFEGGTCGSIKIGTKVALTGSRTGDTTVAASKIAFRDQGSPAPPTEPSRPAQVVEGEGVIGSLSSGTACPALQFLIGSYVIKTDGATQYVGGFCGDLKAGSKVGVRGTLNADGSVTTSRVSMLAETPRPEPEAEGEGFVTGLVEGTACPALQFQIGEYSITVNTSTQFTGGSCSSIAVGKKVGVKGRMTGEKTATASQIAVRN